MTTMGCRGEGRSFALVEAGECFLAGRLSAARALLSDPQSAAEFIEAARYALHAGEYTLAEEHARAAATIEAGTHAERVLARVMGDCARVSRGDAAEESFDLQDLANTGPLLGETVYFVALIAFYQQQWDVAETWLTYHTPSAASLHARYLNLRGIIAGAKERFLEQAKLTERAILLLRQEAPENVTLLAASAHLLAALVREVPFVGGAELLESLEREIAWTDELDYARFHILRSLAWQSALRSEYVPAIQLLHRALPFATTDALRVYGYLDQAMVSLFAGDQTTPRATFGLADEIAQRIDWKNVHDETIAVLPFMAQVGVDINPERARHYCTLAQECAGNIGRRWLLAYGSRLRACISEAIALAYDEDVEKSTREARAAYESFAAIGYAWRAGRMAIHMLRLTNDREWCERAQEQLAAYGKSPFARVLAKLSIARRSLSTRERQVLALLQKRRTIEEIAQELCIRPNTVRVHIGKINYAFGVNRTAQLLKRLESA